MAISLYQCSHCKYILSDSNCIKEQVSLPNVFCFTHLNNVTVDSEIHIDESVLNGDCCWRFISCSQCSSPLGKLFVSTTDEHDLLRNTYCVAKDSVLEYKIHEEECGITFELKKDEKQQYYMLGEDAVRASKFLEDLRVLESRILGLYNQIEKLSKSYFCLFY